LAGNLYKNTDTITQQPPEGANPVGMYSWVIRTFESKMKVMSVSTIYS
jgi:hypothetical protein